MRTTLDLDLDLLSAAKELASARRVTLGQQVSDLLRQALASASRAPRVRNGVPLLPRRPGKAPITMAHVNDLRDAD